MGQMVCADWVLGCFHTNDFMVLSFDTPMLVEAPGVGNRQMKSWTQGPPGRCLAASGLGPKTVTPKGCWGAIFPGLGGLSMANFDLSFLAVGENPGHQLQSKTTIG